MLELERIHGDRRRDRRYDRQLDLRFSYRQNGVSRLGAGRTIDLSRSGVRFLTDDPPPRGTYLELHIEWPILLQDAVPLELVMHGRVLRNDSSGTALSVIDFAFHTCGAGSFNPSGPPGKICDLTA